MKPQAPKTSHRTHRRGTAVVLTAVSLTTLIGFAALAVDMGILYNVKAELQRSADSAAMAAAWQLLDPEKLMGLPDMSEEINAAISEATAYAARNKVAGAAPGLRSADVVVGHLDNPSNLAEQMSTDDPNTYNAVEVTVRRDALQNGPIPLLFGQIFGLNSADVNAKATAVFKDGVVGFRTTSSTDTVQLLPLALHRNVWYNLMARGTTNDNYKYDEETGTVLSSPDNILEVNLYPGSGAGQLPPGNFGTVDIGSANNSTATLSRQIRYGINETDLAYHGGELKLSESGTLLLNGDTGLSAAIKDDLQSIIGKPRIIPLFTEVTGNGNNAMYTIVEFVGIRIMYVKLTGAMNNKAVIIQPAYVTEEGAITTTGSGTSYFVYQPVRLAR
ncbi:MAG: hypothetical protein KA354_06825 [Phycisphaerae bacterium]|nr:hypothetical protein [Phycisphaerae bacterium]